MATEDRIFAAVLAELDGLGRLAPLLTRDDVEDIHFEGCEPTMLRMAGGQLVPGPAIASSDDELEQLLRADSTPVLMALRLETEALLLRTRIVADAVRETRSSTGAS